MKRVQVMMDETLLKSLDATDEVKRKGRSAVLRAAISDYLSRLEEENIRVRYQQAYAGERGLGDEFAGWEEISRTSLMRR